MSQVATAAPAMDDWYFDKERTLYVNRWQKGLTISQHDFFRIPLEVRTGGAAAVNAALNQFAQRRLDHAKKIKAGKDRAARDRGEL